MNPLPASGTHDGSPTPGRGQRRSLTKTTLLQMALRISVVVVVVSLVSYLRIMHELEIGVRAQLALFTSERIQIESQWLDFLDRRLTQLRAEYLERYQRMNGVEPAGLFDRYFKMNDDGTAFPRKEFYNGAPGPFGARLEGFSGGIDNDFPLDSDRRLRLVLAQEMLFQHGPGIAQPETGSHQPLTPFVDFYIETPEKDLLVYWPGTPWYPDYKGGYDIATQGDFAKIYDQSIPFAARERSWTGTYRDDVPKIWMVSFTMPVDLNGKSIAGLGVDISLSEINRRLVQNQFLGTTSLIVRDDGRLIAHPALEPEMIAKKGEFDLARDGDAALRDLFKLIAAHPGQTLLDDAVNDRFISVGRIAGPGWLFVTDYPKRLMNSTAARTVLSIFLLGVLSLFIEVGMLWLVLRKQVTQPLESFVRATQAVAAGNLSVSELLPAERSDELGVLAQAFREMARSLAAANDTLLRDIAHREQIEDALRASEERWKFALEGAGDAVWDLHVQTGAMQMSKRWYEMLGYAYTDVENTRDAWEKRVHPDDLPPMLATLQRHLDGHAAFVSEVRLQCKDGRWKWVLARGIVVSRDAGGQPLRMIGTIADISERKRFEEELRQTNETLELRVSQRTQELEVARQQAEAASQVKSQFLANMSHDIRTPMNSIIGMANLALRTGLDHKQRDYVSKIHLSAENLLGIINDILDISKIEAGKLALESRDFNLETLFAGLASQLGESAARKGLSLKFETDPSLSGALRGDPLRLGQVLTNYLGNAIKFTERGGIVVRANFLGENAGGRLIRFEVQDTGIGIRDEFLPHLFEEFHQGDASTTRKYGGTGLGLAISKQLVELMGGQVGVVSVLGKGSTFWFSVRLPAGVDPVVAARAGDTANVDMIRGATILLVEDHPFNQQVARELLEEAGARVVIAGNGQEAVTWLQQRSCDCVLMDVQMPVMDGIEATRLIRANPALAGLPVIAMTANARGEDQVNCRDVGMDDFVAKPIEPAALFATLGKWLGVRGSAVPAQVPVPSAPAIDSALFDLSELARSFRNDQEKIRKYALLFSQSIQHDMADIETALVERNVSRLSNLGHRAKTSAAMVGARDFAGLCRALEQLRADADMGQAEVMVGQMRALAVQIAEKIRATFPIRDGGADA